MSTNMTQFLNANHITMTSVWAQDNPQMANPIPGASHWRCTFRLGRKRMTTPFSMGSAHRGEPDAASVLDCLASDATGFENAQSFEDWAGEYGYDTDSRTAERTFKAVERQARKLRAFLGDDLYETLLWNTERE